MLFAVLMSWSVEAQDSTVSSAAGSVLPKHLPATSADGRTIGITFDKPLDSTSATRLKNYQVEGTRLRAATLTECRKTVIIQLDEPLKGKTVTVSDLKDTHGNPLGELQLPIHQLGWTVSDIGNPAEPGYCFARHPDSIHLRCGGKTIWQEADTFTFVHRRVTGDFDVRVQLARLDFVHSSTRAGLMLRENLTPGSRNVFVGTYPINATKKWVATCRTEFNGTSSLAPGRSYITRSETFDFPNAWVRLKRFGNTITAYYSTDGTSWHQLGKQLVLSDAFPETVHLGMAAVAAVDSPGVATIAEFRHFSNFASGNPAQIVLHGED